MDIDPETTIQDIVIRGGAVITLRDIGGALSIGVHGHPKSHCSLTAKIILDSFMRSTEHAEDLYSLEPQGSA
jgi:hypothetical protein